jgi:hypothetical protein
MTEMRRYISGAVQASRRVLFQRARRDSGAHEQQHEVRWGLCDP